jgi:AraC-like DNA-binding protein
MNPRSTTSVNMIRMLLQFASSQGMNANQICSAAGLDPAVLDKAELRISGALFDAVWKAVADRSDDADFGLHFAESVKHLSRSHLLFLVMMNCHSVGDALEKFCQYHNLMNDAVIPKIETRADVALLCWDVFSPDFITSRHTTEALLCVLNSIFRSLTEYTCIPLEVRFQHAAPGDISEHTRIFRAPLVFNQPRSALVISSKHLDRPIFPADPELLEILERYALNLLHRIYLPDTFSDKVVKLLMKNMFGQRPSIASVAGDMAMSVRNLQNKLRQEGTTFKNLLEHVGKETAMAYLKDPQISIYDVAFVLGFSEQSAFNHAFKRWTGLTPKSYRKNIGIG